METPDKPPASQLNLYQVACIAALVLCVLTLLLLLFVAPGETDFDSIYQGF